MHKFSQIPNRFINSVTMYRLILYCLLSLTLFSFIGSFAGHLPYSVESLVLSLIVSVTVCFISNILLCKIFKAVYNFESSFITALILFLIMMPGSTLFDLGSIASAGLFAMTSKYVLAYHKKHIFNPVAISIFILGFLGNPNVFWWVGSSVFLPLTVIAGFLIINKIRRGSLVVSFLITSLLILMPEALIKGMTLQSIVSNIFTSGPIIFFSAFMVTEPLTTPPKRYLQIIYGMIVGVLFTLKFQMGNLYATPEFALIIGNIFSYLVSSKQRLILSLVKKTPLSKDIYSFEFHPHRRLEFQAGQYLEWTLPLKKIDSRGNRRYFTIASSPTEKTIQLGIKILPKNGSAFKEFLKTSEIGVKILAGQLAGDFVLPRNKSEKLVFIAGGIGVTPFRSMIKYLVDCNEKRDIIFFYASSTEDGFIYKDIFEKATNLGVKVIYLFTDKNAVPKNWKGRLGYLSTEIIREDVPDPNLRTYYISGPDTMVNSYKSLLSKIGVKNNQIKTDYFPGF